MPWTTNPYCTVQDVKDALDLQSTAQDEWIAELIADAQSFIDEVLGYTFQTTTETRYFDGHEDRDSLIVGDCISVSNVTEDAIDITAQCYLAPYNANVKYKLVKVSTSSTSPNEGVEFSPGRRNVAVTGTWGRASIPGWVKRIAVRLVVHWVKMQDVNYADMMSDQAGVKQHYMKRIPDDVTEMLNAKARRFFRSLR